MDCKINILKEKRFSLKIISGKIRRHLPKWLYELFLDFRYAVFKRSCVNNGCSHITYSDGSWVNRKPTSDIKLIAAYLKSLKAPLRIVQVGIGNSYLFSEVGERASHFVGVTISSDELEYAKKTFPECLSEQYKVIFSNKYTKSISSLGSEFDCIVDNDISSYACCREHFLDMFAAYNQMLCCGGSVLVGLKGLGYFDSGFGLSERAFSLLAKKYNFSLLKNEFCYVLTKIK